jgi:hypothetical protein
LSIVLLCLVEHKEQIEKVEEQERLKKEKGAKNKRVGTER